MARYNLTPMEDTDARPSSFSIGTCSAHVVCFGLLSQVCLACQYDDGRYYRAPELILDRNLYGTAIDLWSYGCILAEICRGTPIFVGSDSVTQVRAVAHLCPSVHS